jgi:hypothetical protein
MRSLRRPLSLQRIALLIALFFVAFGDVVPTVGMAAESSGAQLDDGGRRRPSGSGRSTADRTGAEAANSGAAARERAPRGNGASPSTPPGAEVPATAGAPRGAGAEPTSGIDAAAANEAELTAARERVEAMEALSRAYMEQLTLTAREFEAKMKTATTPDARRALQLELQQTQRARQEEFQRRMAELKGR